MAMVRQLWDHCLSHNLEPPKYDTKMLSDTRGGARWQSTVTAEGVQFKGKAAWQKRETQNSAAKIAFEALSRSNKNPKTLLNEYFQKRHKTLPVFDVSPKAPFEGTVTLFDGTVLSTKATHSSRKHCLTALAKQALDRQYELEDIEFEKQWDTWSIAAQLPPELWLGKIAAYLQLRDVVALCRVSKSMLKNVDNHVTWRRIYEKLCGQAAPEFAVSWKLSLVHALENKRSKPHDRAQNCVHALYNRRSGASRNYWKPKDGRAFCHTSSVPCDNYKLWKLVCTTNYIPIIRYGYSYTKEFAEEFAYRAALPCLQNMTRPLQYHASSIRVLKRDLTYRQNIMPKDFLRAARFAEFLFHENSPTEHLYIGKKAKVGTVSPALIFLALHETRLVKRVTIHIDTLYTKKDYKVIHHLLSCDNTLEGIELVRILPGRKKKQREFRLNAKDIPLLFKTSEEGLSRDLLCFLPMDKM